MNTCDQKLFLLSPWLRDRISSWIASKLLQKCLAGKFTNALAGELTKKFTWNSLVDSLEN